jgi:hypothetical protein
MTNTMLALREQFVIARDAFDSRVQRGQLMCDIHAAYQGPDGADHICLGCTLDSVTAQLAKFLRQAAHNEAAFEPEDLVAMFAYLVNALYERICDVFGIIGVPESYRCRHYQPFIVMRRWANFFKHPKAFGWLVHHPTFCARQTREEIEARKASDRKEMKLVDDDFLDKFYSSEEKGKGIVGAFRGFETRVTVILPPVGEITIGICDSLVNFVGVVTKNPVYVELLRDKAVIANYYEQVSTVTTTTTTTTTTTLTPEAAASCQAE